mgnify:CR=1 FL=1
MICWFCKVPLGENGSPAPAAELRVHGHVVAVACEAHGGKLDRVLRAIGAARHFARIWVERQSRAAGPPEAAPPGDPPKGEAA